MSAYLWPLKAALILFPIISFLLLIPYMVYQYYKYGAVSKKRSIILYSFIYYLTTVYFLVILPLPDPKSVTKTYQEMMQLRPFKFVLDFMNHSSLNIFDLRTYKKALLQGVFTQPVFNVIMTLPFGMYLRFYFRKSKIEVILYSFLLSLFFELSQLSGLFGIYPGPYRLFDVDDLILNTLGGYIGYFCGPLIGLFFPSKEAIDKESYEASKHVGYIRRYLSLILDLFLIKVMLKVFTLIMLVLGFRLDPNSFIYNAMELVFYILYFVFFVYFNQGQSLMQKLLHLKIVSIKGSLTIQQVLIRAGFIYIFIVKFNLISLKFFDLVIGTAMNSMLPLFLYLFIIAFYYIIFAAHIVFTFVRKEKIVFYDRITHTRVLSQFEKNVNY